MHLVAVVHLFHFLFLVLRLLPLFAHPKQGKFFYIQLLVFHYFLITYFSIL